MFSSVLILCFLGTTLGEDWDYENQDKWPGLCNTGTKQSPVNIDTGETVKHFLNEIEYVDYDKAFDFIMKNTGQTVRLLPKSERPVIRGKQPLNSVYIFSELDFHWGSEHRIDFGQYDLEVQFVHYNAKYENISVASKHTRGVAVISVLCHVSKRGNKNFDNLVKGVSNVREFSATSEIKDFKLSSIFPSDHKLYYSYMGSATYPNCEEDVLWIIIKNPTHIAKEHVDQFTKIKDAKGKEIKKNYREIHSLRGRGILAYEPK